MVLFPATLYDAIPVKLIHEGNMTRPEPEFSTKDSAIVRLRQHLGVSIAYLIDRYGPVDIPKIQIAYNPEAENDEYYAVMVSGSGAYRNYRSAWSYITHVFQGIEAVYHMPQSKKFRIPVTIGYNYQNAIGHGSMVRGAEYTDLHIRIAEPIPEEMFNNLLAINFTYMAAPRNKS